VKKIKNKKNIYLEPWYLYILVCDNGNFYTGITKDLERRLKQHQSGKGARYTRIYGAVQIMYSEKFKNYRKAAVREIQIKKLARSEKQKLFIYGKRNRITKSKDKIFSKV
jgi:putative endonuclease